MTMSEDERRLHQDTMSARNEELRTIWLVNGFFSAIHTAAAGFVLVRIPDLWIYVGACGAGTVMSVFWYIAAERMWLWLAYWNRNLARLEEDVDEFKRIFGGRRYEIEVGKGLSISRIVKIFIVIVGLGWLTLANFAWLGLYPKF